MKSLLQPMSLSRRLLGAGLCLACVSEPLHAATVGKVHERTLTLPVEGATEFFRAVE